MARKSYPVTWLDFGVGIFAGFLLGESPFTPTSAGPKLAIGAVTAGLYVWWKSTRPRQSTLDTAGNVWAAALKGLQSLPVSIWLCLIAWLSFFAPTLSWMYARWTGSFWHNNHSMIIAVLIVLLTRATLKREADQPMEGSLWGLPPLLFGLVLGLADSGAGSHLVASIGFVVSLPALVLLLLGVHRLKKLWLPLTMTAFLIPMPSLIANHTFLREVTAEGVLFLLQSLGVNASLYFSRIELPGNVFLVSEACSGFSTLVAAISLSLFLVASCTSRARRIAVILAILPLTLVANTLRVLLLVFISMAAGVDILDTMAHEGSGVLTFVVVIGTLFLIAGKPPIAEAFE
ncbi:MAG: exosortase/archaeosortase family protein [Myxococcota bacterium]|nr:exosortase/archaeosortase family protein [Myxococcota bacterium]